ncbi:hypothetical protein DRO35_05430 [Candidatus Bathyarchaeota archaeon]|nr:MAG: hypothetical protein DRO35_05430 [Candidatus Bathyarchaeota archaeon]
MIRLGQYSGRKSVGATYSSFKCIFKEFRNGEEDHKILRNERFLQFYYLRDEHIADRCKTN